MLKQPTHWVKIWLRLPPLSPIVRISIGLVSLTVFLMLALDLLFGMLSNHTDAARKARSQVSEHLASSIAAVIGVEDKALLERVLHSIVTRSDIIVSIGIRTPGGALYAQTRAHHTLWAPPKQGKSTLTHVMVPMFNGDKVWGTVEIRFKPVMAPTLAEWLQGPAVSMVIPISLAGFVLFFLYMRRVLQHLDPTSVIPDRVRTAFDTLTEGVMIIDDKGRIVLTNGAFGRIHPDAEKNLVGKRPQELAFLSAALSREEGRHPWVQAMRDETPVTRHPLEIPHSDGGLRKIMLNCAPIVDAYRKVRGCLITFDDITDLDRANADLRQTLQELDRSKLQIEQQNEELRRLAARDPLTGCLNRRAFFELMQPLFLEAQVTGHELSCIVVDIDHFKSINDRFGHATGDQVIRLVAKTLGDSLRPEDLLCRYGGEEFCLVLPQASLDNAIAIANRLRLALEAIALDGARLPAEVEITASFGVASLAHGAVDSYELIDQADAALYAAKRAGRNRVEVCGYSELAAAER